MAGSAKASPAHGSVGEDKRKPRDGGEQLADIQRARIVLAMVDVAAERGVGSATVARVVACSGVSRRTFYEHFEDREECFLAAFDHSVERIAATIVPAYRGPGSWRERVRAALTALLEAIEHERAATRVAIVEALGAGPRALESRGRVLAQIAAAIDEGRGEAGKHDGPPPLTAEGVVGGALALIHARMLDPECQSQMELLGSLVAMIVLPYLGPAAARREIDRPAPPPVARQGAPRGVDPLRELDIRLTYRTVRVLLAVGEPTVPGTHPSNREVADAAGIRDQGQVSKLLSRLEQLGLVTNTVDPTATRGPNAWTLTDRGAEVRGVISG